MILNWLLLAASLAAGVTYLLRAEAGPYRGRVLVKGASIGAMAALSALWLIAADAPAFAWLLVLALALSSAGDVFLALAGERNFLRGLVAFLLGHVAYTVLFVLFVASIVTADLFAAVALLVAAGGYFLWLRPYLGNMRLPVLCYVLVIVCMGVAALLADFGHWWVPAGALAFIVSDAVLAADRFARPFKGAGYIIWLCYFSGQAAIAYGMVKELARI